MVILFLSLIVCVVAIIVLFKAKPNLFMFQLIERVFGKDCFIKKKQLEDRRNKKGRW